MSAKQWRVETSYGSRAITESGRVVAHFREPGAKENAAEFARLLSRVAELEKALAPFASIGIEHWPKERMYFDVSMRRDLIEAARQALTQPKEGA